MNILAVRKKKCGEITRMHISEEGLSLIKKFEGCELKAYRCAANVLTIGYGTINMEEMTLCGMFYSTTIRIPIVYNY